MRRLFTAHWAARGSRTALVSHVASDRSGSIAPIFAICVTVLTLVVAMAVDVGRWAIARNELQASLDGAVLAGAASLRQTGATEKNAVDVAQKAYQANKRSQRFSGDINANIQFTVDGSSVIASGVATINTVLGKMFGIPTLPLLGSAGAGSGSGTSAVGAVASYSVGSGTKFEIALMLDITGSMCEPKNSPCTSAGPLDAMKTAAGNLVSMMLSTEELRRNVRISIVPFSDGVLLPRDASGQRLIQTAAAGPVPPVQEFYKTNGKCDPNVCYRYVPGDCVAERTGSSIYTDQAPGPGKYVSYIMEFREIGAAKEDPSGCTMGPGSSLVPLTNNLDRLRSRISGLVADGGTSGHIGTAWAWYTLSPNWKDVFPGTESDPAPYPSASDKSLRKIAVLMTDGEYNFTFMMRDTTDCKGTCAYAGYTKIYQSRTNADSNMQAVQLCKAMKSAPNNIEVFTVGYGALAEFSLKGCASDTDHYFKAATGAQLVDAFKAIGEKLLGAELHLSK